MKPGTKIGLLLFLSLLGSHSSNAQCPDDTGACTQTVPHFVKFSGTLKGNAGAPLNGIVPVRFVIYGVAVGGTPFWQEVQNAQVDEQGHYDVTLGATSSTGIPMDLFTTGEPRWLGVQSLLPGQDEQPRVLLVSVPYALQAENAQTLGGMPASAFAKASASAAILGSPVVETIVPAAIPAASTGLAANPVSNLPSAQAATPATGLLNTIPKFWSNSSLVDSQIRDQDGIVTLENLSNVIFADRFRGGISAAIAACPEKGCIISAVSPRVNLNLENIDPGYKSVTIYLGPYTYTVRQITLRKGLKIIGMGASGGVVGSVTCSTAAPCNGTALQSINGNNPVFVIPQSSNEPATNVMLSGFRLYGSVGNTSEDGFFLDTSSSVNTGLWNSVLEDISLQGFAGIGIHIKGRDDNFSAASQWLLFNNLVVFRTRGGGNALRIEGAAFELRFRNCEFDGQSMGDGTNIYVGGLSSREGGNRGFPLSITFEGLVSQVAALAVQIDGVAHISFYDSHHELLWGGYQITNNSNIGAHGVMISDAYFAGNVGVNAGAGFALNVATTQAEGIVFVHNQLFGNPDSVVAGTNLSSVVYRDNLYNSGTLLVPPTTGLTSQLSPAPTINIQGVHTVGLNPSTTPITSIQSGLGPGEMVTFYTLSGPVIFSSGGNIDLMGMSSLTVNGTITFVRSDLGGTFWKPVSQWTPTPASPSPTIEPSN
jgi:hypothetical protein